MFSVSLYIIPQGTVAWDFPCVHCYIHKWKNHFVEMKGDVGMSVHEKGGKQVNAYIYSYTNTQDHNPIPTSL